MGGDTRQRCHQRAGATSRHAPPCSRLSKPGARLSKRTRSRKSSSRAGSGAILTTWSVQTTLSTAPLLLIPLLLLLLGLLVVLLVGRGHQVVQQQARQEQEQAQAPDQEAQRSQVSIPNWTTIARSVQALRRARARARNLTPSSQAQTSATGGASWLLASS